MDIKRIIDRFDRLMKEDAFDEAEKHLLYWLEEAEFTDDKRVRFTILNEMTGFYRLRGKRMEAFRICDKLLEAIEDLKLGEGDTSRATAYLNIATVYNRFNESAKAVELYTKTLDIYRKTLLEDDERLAALYNNMALAIMNTISEKNKNGSTEGVGLAEADGLNDNDSGVQELALIEKLDKAEMLFMKALEILGTKNLSENEQAITYLNLADLEEKKSGPEAGEERILDYVENASVLLDKSYNRQDSDFLQTAEKCYPVFKKYGRFAYANELAERIKKLKEKII